MNIKTQKKPFLVIKGNSNQAPNMQVGPTKMEQVKKVECGLLLQVDVGVKKLFVYTSYFFGK